MPFYGPVVIMRLLFAVHFLLNIAYHETCHIGMYGPRYPTMQEAMGGGYGRMGMMWQCPLALGHLGQMGQMMRRNGNIFQMPPIKKKLPNSGGGFSQIPLFFCKRNCHKMGYMGGGGGGWGGIPIFSFLLGASFNTEIALAMQSYNFFDMS